MAEFVLTKLAESVLSQTVERIAELLIHEAASLKSVRDDVVLLQDELESLQGFIKSADTKQHYDQHLQRLVLKVKDVASDAEDVIESYIHKVASSYINVFHNKRVRDQISFVRERIKVIYTSMQAYGIASTASGEAGTSTSMPELQRSLRRSSPNEEDNDVIILEKSARDLTAELTTKEEDRLCIISVVGMGGLGKTTLAKKVFNSVKQHFESCAWVFLSQRFVPKDVFIEIIKQVDSSSKTHDLQQKQDHELIDLVKEELKEKRFLVVLDDIWTIAAWDSIKRAFPNGKKGSKLLFTTRNKEVATSADPLITPIEPRVLTLKESWKLLQRKAFPRSDIAGDSGSPFPPKFEELGKEMAQKCGGLPLALVVLGGLLRTKTTLEEWKKVMRDVNSHLNKVQSHQQYEGVKEILGLSYYDLPYYLKPCFLYLGNYPEDYEIPKRNLVRLWIGEGFIPTSTPTTTGTRGEMEQTLMEDVAEAYLEELIHRCMVQVEKRDHTGILGVKTCRMHDLMRDLCTSKAREESFAQIIQQQQQHDHKSNLWTDVSAASSIEHLGSSHSRRLVIHSGAHLQYRKTHWAWSNFFRKLVNPCSSSVESNWEEQVHPNLRSLLCLDKIFLPSSALKSSNFRMLRVLELHLGYESKIPGGIGNLIYLRYLWLSIPGGISLPSSIGNLRNLHTLHIKNCKVIGSVGMISRLIRLRHLLLPSYILNTNQKHFRIDKLKDIETLKNIPPSVLLRSYDALHKLTNLRKISIEFDGNHIQDDVRRVLGSQIVESGRLTSLKMYISGDKDEFSSLESLSSCHSLSKLVLEGKMILQQGLIHLPESLTKLMLFGSRIEQDPMPVLEKLPNLRFLILHYNAYVGSTMVCSAHGFPKLETLQLSSLMPLRKWIVEKGAMPSLKKLTISYIPNLEMIPEGFEFLTSLKELEIMEMSNSFCEKLQVKNGIEGEDYYKVRHIPSISFMDIED